MSLTTVLNLSEVDDAVDENVRSGELLVLFFTSDGCESCQKIEDLFNHDGKDFKDLRCLKIVSDVAPEVAKYYGVELFPTVLLYRGGEFIAEHWQIQPLRQEIRNLLVEKVFDVHAEATNDQPIRDSDEDSGQNQEVGIATVSTIDELDNAIDENVDSGEILVLFFVSDWCKSCQSMAKDFLNNDEDKEDFSKVRCLKIATDVSPKAAEYFDVDVVPTVLFYREGELIEEHVLWKIRPLRDFVREFLDILDYEEHRYPTVRADEKAQSADKWAQSADKWGQSANEWAQSAEKWAQSAEKWGQSANEWAQSAQPGGFFARVRGWFSGFFGKRKLEDSQDENAEQHGNAKRARIETEISPDIKKCKIQINLANGTKLQMTDISVTQKASDIRAFILLNFPDYKDVTFQLLNSPPTNVIDEEKTVEEESLANAVVIQHIVMDEA